MKLALSFLGEDLSKVNWRDVNAMCDRIHVDLADGKFVSPPANYPPSFLNQLPFSLPLDIHFMTKNPSRRFAHYAKLRLVKTVNFHLEIGNTNQLISAARKHKFKVGIAINPETPTSKLAPYIDLIDEVLIMGVHPGLSGQKFLKNTIKRIDEVRALRKNIFIKVDGGINADTISLVKHADLVVSASYIFNSASPKEAMRCLKQQE